MKIAFVIHSLEPSLGGVERYAYSLGCELARRGVEVTAFTQRPPAHPEPPERFRLETLAAEGGAAQFDAAVARRVAELGGLGAWDVVQGFGPGRVHTHHRIGGGSHPAYLRAMARYEPGARRLLARLRRFQRRHRTRVAAQRALLRAPGVQLFANSERSRRDACRDYRLDPARIEVIHNGVDLAHFGRARAGGGREALRQRLAIEPAALAVAFVGSGFARKGLGFALEMLARARARGTAATLLVAGRDPVATWRARALRLGAAPHVRFLGPLADVRPLYAACDALLLPSLYEPFGMAPLEAMASGLPIAVTRESGVAELLCDGREGRLLPAPDAIEAGAEFLAALAREPQWARELGARARRTAEGLSLARHADRLLGFYVRGCTERQSTQVSRTISARSRTETRQRCSSSDTSRSMPAPDQ